MLGNLLLKVCVPALLALLAALPLVWLRERNVDLLQAVLRRFRRLSLLGQVLAVVFVACLVVHGGTKGGGSDDGPAARTGSVDGTDASLSSGQLAAGFVLRRGIAGATVDFDPPPGALVHEPWVLRGAHVDHFTIAASADAPWSFPFGTGVVERATVSAQGAVLLHYGRSGDALGDGGLLRDLRAGTGVRDDALLLAPLRTRLGVLPAARWNLLPAGTPSSRFWHAVTDSGGLLLTWQNVALDRNAAAPVSVQVELMPSGAFVYRYRLPSVPASLFGTDLLVGAWNAGHGESLGDNRAGLSYAGLFDHTGGDYALEWYPLDPADAWTEDRDGDGLSTYDELYVHGTDPGCFDTDGDGVGDGAELARGLAPLQRDSDEDGLVDGSDPDPLSATPLDDLDADGLPDAYERHWFGETNVLDAAQLRDATGFTPAFKLGAGLDPTAMPSVRTVVTNRLVSYKLWDGFSATLPAGATNLVFSRTLEIGRRNGWEQFFLSSAPGGAGGWGLEGLVLEWETSGGASGTAVRSPFGDSLHLPLPRGEVASLTIRLRATGAHVRSGTPLYLLAHAPRIEVTDGRVVTLQDGGTGYVFTRGSQSRIGITVDRSNRPCRAELYPAEREMEGLDAETGAVSGFAYEGDCGGGVIRMAAAGIFALPISRVRAPGRAARSSGAGEAPASKVFVLSPHVGYVGGSHCEAHRELDWDPRTNLYSTEDNYPLDSPCLWQNWWRPSHQGYVCHCRIETSSGVSGSDDVSTSALQNGSGAVSVGGTQVWSGKAEHATKWACGGVTMAGTEILSELEDCQSCESSCTGGKCEDNENHGLGSVKFRIPLGMSAAKTLSGFLYFRSEGPVCISPSTFETLLHPDATNRIEVTETATSRRFVDRGVRGRDVFIAATNNGVRIVIATAATGALEHTWEVTNPDGDDTRVRLRKVSRQNNVMDDWTYACEEDARGGWRWSAFDNIAQVGERLERNDRLNDPSARTLEETRTRFDATGRFLGSVRTVSEAVGECANAKLREVLREENTGRCVRRRTAEYWRDDDADARNGRPRLVRGDDVAWRYHDWDAQGREILRVEQRDGSPLPSSFPVVSSNGLDGVANDLVAFVTVFDHEPMAGDTGPLAMSAQPRAETRYAVRDGEAVCTGRSWHRYRNVSHGGVPCIQHERWRAADALADPVSGNCAYESRTTVEDLGEGVSTVMSGQVVEELDADGVRTVRTFVSAHDALVCTTRTFHGEAEYPVYTVEELDPLHGTVLRRTVRLTATDVAVEDEQSVYDEKNRLRSTLYGDGSSLTNAYSCCRLLWSRDREGRRRLRSGRTGSDHLYNAEEEVWMLDVNSNGFPVVQHFLDAFGRETNTVTYVGTAPGEADDWTAALGRERTRETTEFPYGGDDCRVTRDARGKVTQVWTDVAADREETREETSADDPQSGPVLCMTTVRYRNGGSRIRREWDGMWSEEIRTETYDPAGRRVAHEITESSDYGVVTNAVVVYDWLGREVLRTTPLGVTASVYDGTASRRVSSTTAAGATSRTTTELYDALGRAVGKARDGVTNLTEEAYAEIDGSWWRVTRRVEVGGATNSATEVREQLTDLSDACRSRRVEVSAAGVVTETVRAYDPGTGRETETTTSSVQTPRTRVFRGGLELESTSAEGTVFTTYDVCGRAVLRERTVGTETVRRPVSGTVYNVFGDVAASCAYTNDQGGATAYYAYDSSGREIAVTNAQGDVTTTVYDGAGQVVARGGAVHPMRYAYDSQGRPVSQATTRDGVQWDVTRWSYDAETGLCRSRTYPDGSMVRYEHTADGLPFLVVQPSLAPRTSIYDARRRLVGVCTNNGALACVFTYDAFGRKLSESNDVARTVYRLGAQGVATNETTTVGASVCTQTRALDGFGRIAARSAGGTAQQIAYTAENRVGTIVSPAGTASYAYGADGRETGRTLALAGGTVVSSVVARDPYRADLVTGVSNYVNGVLVGGYAYGYDALARVVRRNADRFGYDVRGEVTSATVAGRTETHAYDEIGNRTAASWGGAGTLFEANGLNQYVSMTSDEGAETPVHTADGQLASIGGTSYAYDDLDRLVSVSVDGVEVERNAYDAQGRRVRIETAESTRLLFYDGWNPVREVVAHTNGVTDVVEYAWGCDLSGALDGAGGAGGLLHLSVNGAVYVPLYDAAGHVVAYCDASGSVVAAYVYDAFGRTVSATGVHADLFRIRYATKYADAATGLIDYGYRFYDPALGRWLTRDPLEEAGGPNLYAFCGNDPVNQVELRGGRYALLNLLHDALCDSAYLAALQQLDTAQDRRAWSRYTKHDGSHSDRNIRLTPQEVKRLFEHSPEVVAYVESGRSRCRSGERFDEDKMLTGVPSSPWIKSIGSFSADVRMSCREGCFSYRYVLNDFYDFDVKFIHGNLSRGFWGEAQTTAEALTEFCLQCDWQSFFHVGEYRSPRER